MIINQIITLGICILLFAFSQANAQIKNTVQKDSPVVKFSLGGSVGLVGSITKEGIKGYSMTEFKSGNVFALTATFIPVYNRLKTFFFAFAFPNFITNEQYL